MKKILLVEDNRGIREATGNDVYDHTVTVYMKRIRGKIGDDVIKTVKGIGYRIDTEGNSNVLL